MSATVLYMSMSLDGFIAGPNAGMGVGLGEGGERLHEWMHLSDADPDSGIRGRPAGINGQLFDEFMATGAVVAGRGCADLGAQSSCAGHRCQQVAARHLCERCQDRDDRGQAGRG